MKPLVFRQQAVTDLNAIWNYTYSTWSEIQADKYYFQIKACCNEISKRPFLGKPYEEISSGLCGVIVGKHIVFHQLLDSEIHILRILHNRMDIKAQLE